MDSFQLNRKTNSRNSRNTLHWLLGLQSKCLGWNRVGQSPSITHLMVQPRCPAAASHWGRAPSSAPVTTAIPLCSALWGLGTGAPGYAHTGNPQQQGRRQGRDQLYCWMVKASSTLILSNQGTGRGGGSLQCSLMQFPFSRGRGN